MSALFQFFLFLLTLNNLALLGMGRLRTLINLVTAQGILLGGLLLIHDHALLAVAVLLIKGGLLPWLLHAARSVPTRTSSPVLALAWPCSPVWPAWSSRSGWKAACP